MLRTIVLILTFFIFGVSYSQVQSDTILTNYVWSFEPSFDHPTQRESYGSKEKNIQYGRSDHAQAKKIITKYLNRFDQMYTSEMLASLMTGILQSDVVFVDHPSEFIYEIQYGNYQDGGFGLQTIGSFTHCTIDVSQKRIVPQFQLCVTY